MEMNSANVEEVVKQVLSGMTGNHRQQQQFLHRHQQATESRKQQQSSCIAEKEHLN